MSISVQQALLLVSSILLSRSIIAFGFTSASTTRKESSFVLQSSISGMPYDQQSSSLIFDESTLEKEILSIATMNDEAKRRIDFESFVNQHIQAEQQQKTYLKISDLSFVRDVTDCLTRLGETVQIGQLQQRQKKEKRKDVMTGLVAISGLQQAQLWTFVDLLIQFKALVQKWTEEKSKNTKKEWCGRCKVCTCGKRI